MCPSSFVVNTTKGETQADVTWTDPKVTDDNQPDSGDDYVELLVKHNDDTILEEEVPVNEQEEHQMTLGTGVYVVTYSYTDLNLQKGICTFTISVQGNVCMFVCWCDYLFYCYYWLVVLLLSKQSEMWGA